MKRVETELPNPRLQRTATMTRTRRDHDEALVFGGIPVVQVSNGNFVYAVYLMILTAALVAVCSLTGEPPRWRWGRRDAG